MKANIIKIPLFLLMVAICSGCSLSYRLNQPAGSHYQYDSVYNKPVKLFLVDKRTETDFFTATSNLASVNLKLQNVNDPILWLSQALQNEFLSRGMDIQVYTNKIESNSDLILYVTDYQIINYRASGFTPWVSYHLFNGELTSRKDIVPIRAYFLYGKVPVWSMDEIQGPCIDMPMSILVKEIASKINRSVLHYSVSNKNLEEINNKINEELKNSDTNTYLTILELGGSNNPNAMQMLHNFSTVENILFRACALSSMGILGAQNEFEFLKNKYNEFSDIDRFMALKSIGDIGTPEAIKFLKNAKVDPKNENEPGIQYCVELFTKYENKYDVKSIAEGQNLTKENEAETEFVSGHVAAINNSNNDKVSPKKDRVSLYLVINDQRKIKKVNGTHGELIKDKPEQSIKSKLENELKSLDFEIVSNASIGYTVEIKKFDLDYPNGSGMPMTASIELNVKITSIDKSHILEKNFLENYSVIVSSNPRVTEAKKIYNECINKIVKKISRDEVLVSSIKNINNQ